MKRHLLARIGGLTPLVFYLLVSLSLLTPSWRYGPFSWWPVWHFSELAGGPVALGLLNVLPGLLLVAWIIEKRASGSAWHRGEIVVTLPMAVFTLWALVRLDYGSARLLFIYGGAFALTWLVYLYAVNERPRLWPALVAVISVQSLIAVAQFLVQADLGLEIMGELPLNPAFEGVTVLFAREQPWLRAYGLTAHPNFLGAMLAALLALLLPAYQRSGDLSRKIMAATLALGMAGLLVTFSRSAWLALALGTATWLLLQTDLRRFVTQGRHREAIILALPVTLIVVLFLILYPDLVLSRFLTLDRPLEARSIYRRLYDARLAMAVAGDHPWLGAGLGHYVDAARQLSSSAERVHNVFLLVLAELGLVGLAPVVGLLLAPMWRLWRSCGHDRRRCAAGMAPWIVMLTVNQFDTTLWLTANWQTAILFGLLAANLSTELGALSCLNGRR